MAYISAYNFEALIDGRHVIADLAAPSAARPGIGAKGGWKVVKNLFG